MLRKKKGGGKKHLSPERSVNPKKKLSPIQQLQLQDQQHAQVSQVAPSGRVAGPTPVAGFQSRDILTPYAPLSSLNPDGRHESRRRGQAQQVFSNEIKLQQMIDQMHNSSIQDLPWQARACPQALETREAARLRAACRNERRRVQAWRQLEQSRAMEAAEREDRRTEAVEIVARRRAQHAVSKEQQHTRSYEQRRQAEMEERWMEHTAKAEYWRGLGRYELLTAANIAADQSRKAERDALLRSKFHPDSVEAVMDIVNPADKDETRDTNRAASHLERRILASSWLVVLGAELRNRFVDRVQLQWRCGERAALSARLRASVKIEEVASLEVWKVEASRVNAADEEERTRVSTWEQLHDAATRCAQDSVQKMLQQPEKTNTIEAAEQKERISWFAAAIASRARSERDAWMQHRIDAAAASEAVQLAWQKALQQWRSHSETSAQRRAKELNEWLITKYSEEEGTGKKVCESLDVGQRDARYEREIAEARQFDHEVTARMEQLTVRRWALEEWQEERRRAHLFSEKIRQSVEQLWTDHAKTAAAEAEAESMRATEALERAIEVWSSAARAAVRRVAKWQGQRVSALRDAVQLAVTAASAAVKNAAEHVTDPSDVDPILKRFGQDLKQLHEAFVAEEQRAASQEMQALREEVEQAAAKAKEARRQALARAKAFHKEQVRALEKTATDASKDVYNGFTGATRRALVFEEAHAQRLEGQLRNLEGPEALAAAAAVDEQRRAAVKVQSLARKRQSMATVRSMMPSMDGYGGLLRCEDDFEEPPVEEDGQASEGAEDEEENSGDDYGEDYEDDGELTDIEGGSADNDDEEEGSFYSNFDDFVVLEMTTARDVGRPVSIWWDDDAEAYDGVIESFEPGKGWFIVYDDDDEEWNAGPVRVRFRDSEPREKKMQQKLKQAGKPVPKRKSSTSTTASAVSDVPDAVVTQPAAHNTVISSSPTSEQSTALTVMGDTETGQERDDEEDSAWRPPGSGAPNTATAMEVSVGTILNFRLAYEMRVSLALRGREMMRDSLQSTSKARHDHALQELKEAEDHINAAVLRDEEDEGDAEEDTNATYEERAMRQLRLEKEGRLDLLHGARAERRCLRDALASIESRLERNVTRAKATLGVSSLNGEVRRELAAVLQITETHLEANQEQNDMWGRLHAELGEALRREKKAQSGDTAVVRGFVKVAIQKGDDTVADLLVSANTDFGAHIAAEDEAQIAARAATEATITEAKGGMDEHLQTLKSALSAALARGEQVLADAKAEASQTLSECAAQATSLRDEAAHHHGVMSTHKSKAEKEITRLECTATEQVKETYETAVGAIVKLKTTTESEALAVVSLLEKARLSASRAQESRNKEAAALSASAFDAALSALRTSSERASKTVAEVASHLDDSRIERVRAAGEDSVKRDVELADQVNQWFDKARLAAKGSNNREGSAKRKRDLSHSRKVAERTAKEQRGSLLHGATAGTAFDATPDNVKAWQLALDPVLDMWVSPEDAQEDRRTLVDGCDAIERELLARTHECWTAIERRFHQLEFESDGAAAAHMKKMKGKLEFHVCSLAMDSIILNIELKQSIELAQVEQKCTIAKGFSDLITASQDQRARALETATTDLEAAEEAVDSALGAKVRASKLKVESAVLAVASIEKTAQRAVAKAALAVDEAQLALANSKSFSPFKKKKLTAEQKAQRMAAMMNSGIKKRKKLSEASSDAERREIAAEIITSFGKKSLLRMHML